MDNFLQHKNCLVKHFGMNDMTPELGTTSGNMTKQDEIYWS